MDVRAKWDEIDRAHKLLFIDEIGEGGITHVLAKNQVVLATDHHKNWTVCVRESTTDHCGQGVMVVSALSPTMREELELNGTSTKNVQFLGVRLGGVQLHCLCLGGWEVVGMNPVVVEEVVVEDHTTEDPLAQEDDNVVEDDVRQSSPSSSFANLSSPASHDDQVPTGGSALGASLR